MTADVPMTASRGVMMTADSPFGSPLVLPHPTITGRSHPWTCFTLIRAGSSAALGEHCYRLTKPETLLGSLYRAWREESTQHAIDPIGIDQAENTQLSRWQKRHEAPNHEIITQKLAQLAGREPAPNLSGRQGSHVGAALEHEPVLRGQKKVPARLQDIADSLDECALVGDVTEGLQRDNDIELTGGMARVRKVLALETKVRISSACFRDRRIGDVGPNHVPEFCQLVAQPTRGASQVKDARPNQAQLSNPRQYSIPAPHSRRIDAGIVSGA